MLMQHKAAAGYPLAGYQARVHEPDENNHGEIEAKSPLMMHGYYLAGGVFDRFDSEWLRTGDFGTIDQQGAVTLAGRSDDVLKVGGEKVDRFTIETTLSDLLLGFDYCVLPVEHHLLGRCLALFLSQAPPRTLPSRAAIIERLRQSLPNRFIPPLAYCLPHPLPRLSNGKLDRQSLVRRHAEFQRLA
jgi:acyl-CoA synthetase (AMP-forming)/AMP-acid ligase II